MTEKKEKCTPDTLIKVLLVEDHPIYREGLHMILSFSSLKCEVVAEASNVRQTISWLEAHPESIDLAILDYFLPDGNAIDVLATVKSLNPKAKVLLITGEVDKAEVRQSVMDKVNGFISKDVQSSELIKIVTSIMEGSNQCEPKKDVSSDEKSNKSELTQREIEIIKLCTQGMNIRQIANELHISHRTVERHKDNIYSKLGINSTTEMIKYAILNGLL